MKEWTHLPTGTKTNIFVTALLTFSCILGIDIHTPSLPSMAIFFNCPPDTIQLAVPLFILGAGLGILFWGPLSDSVGRKKTLISSAVIVIISALLASRSVDIISFNVFRVVQGFGAGASMCLARVVAADMLKKEEIASIGSLMGLITGLGPLIAPIVGGYIEELASWQLGFITYAFIVSIALMIFACHFTETRQFRTASPSLVTHIAKLSRAQNFFRLVLKSGLVLTIFNAYAVVAPFLIQGEMSLSPTFFGWLSGFCATCQVITKVTVPFVLRHKTPFQVHRMGWCMLILSSVILWTRYLIEPTNLPLFITGMGIAFCSPHMIIPHLVSEVMHISDIPRGILGALYSSGGMLIGFCFTSLISIIPYEGSGLLAGYYTFIALSGFLLSHGTHPPKDKPSY